MTCSPRVTDCHENRHVGFVSYPATVIKGVFEIVHGGIVQKLCGSRGGRPGLSVLTSLLVSVDVKIY